MASAETNKSRHMTYSTLKVDRLEGRHPGLRALVENRLRRRFDQREIAREVERQFGVKISASSIHRFWVGVVQLQEQAEAETYRQARAQAKALLEEMKADPDLSATQIAEILLANQIVKDRLKLGEADIMALYREQREREKLELQRRAFELREKEVKGLLKDETKKTLSPSEYAEREVELRRKIDEIYGISETPAAKASREAGS